MLQLKSVKPGHVVIKGLSSSLFLCVDSGGHLKGQVRESEKCHRSGIFFPLFDLCLIIVRVSIKRTTAPSESCCWQMDTLVSSPPVMEFLCLWHRGIPQIVPLSLSLGFFHSGILYRRRACLSSHPTIRGSSTWTPMTSLGWL